MLKQMGIKSKDIDAQEVIIKQGDKKIIIRDPKVSEMEFSGQKTFQIFGKVSVEEAVSGSEEATFKEKDVQFVVDMTKVNKDKARETLEKTKGDIAKAILILRKS